MARKKRKPTTRYQWAAHIRETGEGGLLPIDGSAPCPKRGGPDHAHPDHPGKVGFATCGGCRYYKGPMFDSAICTHDKAAQVASQTLADAIKAWKAEHEGPRQEALF